MIFLYVAIVIIAGIFALILFFAGIAEGEWKAVLLGLVLAALTVFVIVVPHAKPEQCTYDHKVLLTDTYNDIKYDKVIRVEYDIRKGPWWSWEAFAAEINHKVITEGEAK